MHRIRHALCVALILSLILAVAVTLLTGETHADSWTLGPITLNSSNPILGQPATVNSNFKSPSGTGANFVLDTEVYAASGARVAQWYETVGIGSSQTVSRAYTWQTSGLGAGTYTFKQGVFNAGWSSLVSWNDNAGTVSLTASAPASWSTSARLQTSSATAGAGNAVISTFSVAQSGSFILDTELYDGTGARIAQWFNTQSMNAGSPVTQTWGWTPGNGGNYVVKLGIFNTSWQMQNWNDKALNFTVGQANNPAPVTTPPAANPTPTPNPVPTATPTPGTNPVNTSGFMRGVNLASAEFGESNLPGVYGSDYTYPTTGELDYYNSKGLKLIRLPFRWERLQRSLWANLDTTELSRIDAVVSGVRARGMKVIIEPHNYDRYFGNLVGSGAVPNSAFADFWTKLAAHYNGEPAIYGFSLMNEPHDTGGTWKASAQAGLDGIRQVDRSHMVLVPGDSWSGAWTWTQYNSNLLLNDPANNLMYEAHQYFDRNGSGTYGSSYDGEGAYPTIGVDRVQPFINWLRANNVRGIVTEYGVPNNDQRWLTVLDNFLAKLDAEGIGGTYWAGGPWWGGYALSAEPNNGQDAAVMGVLSRHLGR